MCASRNASDLTGRRTKYYENAPITTIEILSPEQGLDGLMKRINQRHFPAGVRSVWVVLLAVQLVSIFLPDRQRINFSEGVITDPVTGIQLTLTDVFGG